MRKSIILILFIASLFSYGVEKPNVVILLVDDLGYADTSYMNKDVLVKTPNIDVLASQGIVFTRGYSASSVCSPSRYSLLTGRYHWRVDKLKKGVLLVDAPPVISQETYTIANMFKDNGYATACIGKWHLGFDREQRDSKVPPSEKFELRGGPCDRGFDYYFGTDVPNYPPYCFIENRHYTQSITEIFPLSSLPKSAIMNPRGVAWAPKNWKFEDILPTLLTKSLDFIQKSVQEKKPFFLYFAMTTPHHPVMPSSKFKGVSKLSPVFDSIIETDYAIGEVWKEINKLGIVDNTIIIFSADNGHGHETFEEFIGRGVNPAEPYRGKKGDHTEGGFRIPLVAVWKNHINSGVSDQLICHIDLYSTFAKILKFNLPKNAAPDSFNGSHIFLKNDLKTPVRKNLIAHGGRGVFTLLQGDYKYVERWNNSQLYNLEKDKKEMNNIIKESPEIALEMKSVMKKIINEKN